MAHAVDGEILEACFGAAPGYVGKSSGAMEYLASTVLRLYAGGRLTIVEDNPRPWQDCRRASSGEPPPKEVRRCEA